MPTFVLSVKSPDDHEGYVDEALYKIVDDGRLWDLVTAAVAEQATEQASEAFDHAADLSYDGLQSQQQRNAKRAVTLLREVVESNWIGQLSVPDYDAFDQAIAAARSFLAKLNK